MKRAQVAAARTGKAQAATRSDLHVAVQPLVLTVLQTDSPVTNVPGVFYFVSSYFLLSLKDKCTYTDHFHKIKREITLVFCLAFSIV